MSNTPLSDRIRRAGFELRLTYCKDNKPNGYTVKPFDKLSDAQKKFSLDNKPAIIKELVYFSEKYIDDRHYCRECSQSCKSSLDDRPRRCDKFISR